VLLNAVRGADFSLYKLGHANQGKLPHGIYRHPIWLPQLALPVALILRIVPASVERSTYVLMSSLLLALICSKWQAIPVSVWDITSPVLRALVNAIFAVGWLILFLLQSFSTSATS
jgi:hypothetical protein